MNSADQTETGVEVEVEYEVDWYVVSAGGHGWPQRLRGEVF